MAQNGQENGQTARKDGGGVSDGVIKSRYLPSVVAAIVLAVPFIVGTITLNGLRDHIVTFHGSDEDLYHYPVILQFIKTFPQMSLWDYPAAMTPFFHVLLATIGKLISPALPFLRGINVAISYGCALMLFFMFNRGIRLDAGTSLLVALALILSPYVFGVSFLIYTDNLAALFAVAALFSILLYARDGNWNLLALSALFAACAALTRQLYLWLMISVLVAGVSNRNNSQGSVVGTITLLTLAFAPLVVLFVSWGGFNPPSSPSVFHLSLRPVAFFTACVGAYAAPFLFLVLLWKEPRSVIAHKTHLLLVPIISTVLLWLGPLRYLRGETQCNLAGCEFATNGFLWRLSKFFPEVGGSSLLFWTLIPLGLATVLREWQKKGFRSPALVVYLSFAAISIGNKVLYQKYFDFISLLAVCLIMFRPEERYLNPRRFILLAYCVVFLTYAVGNPFKGTIISAPSSGASNGGFVMGSLSLLPLPARN